jgi:hypothetical protein
MVVASFLNPFLDRKLAVKFPLGQGPRKQMATIMGI